MLQVISLQYNPDTLSRTLQSRRPAKRRSLGGAAPQGAAGRDDQARGRDRRDRSARVPRRTIRQRCSSASSRSSPRSRRSSIRGSDAAAERRAGGRRARSRSRRCEAPLTLFVWSAQRIVPVRITEFSITEEAFDPALNPIRAKVSLGMRVLTRRRPRLRRTRAAACSWPTCSAKEQLARKAPRARAHAASASEDSMSDPIQALIQPAMQATPRSRRPAATTARRSPTLAGADGRTVVLPAAPLRAAARALRAARRASSSPQGDRLDNIAARYLGDPEQFWRICDANGAMRPDELTDDRRPPAAHHAARRHAGARAMLERHPPHAADRPGGAGAGAAQSVIDALASVQVTTGDGPQRLPARRSRSSKTSPLLTTLLPAGYFDPMITRVVIIATRRTACRTC